METHVADWLAGTREGTEAEAILRKCVHCGFCTATCPTYQLLGDELDGPRGRIYLIKQVVEGHEPTEATRTHLDRCLTCRNCETTCPSGVQYGRLVEIGRRLVEAKVPRTGLDKAKRVALREGMTRRWLFDPAMKLGQAVRPLVPSGLRDKVTKPRAAGQWPTAKRDRKVLLLDGCVQPSMAPSIDPATARVLDAIGVTGVFAQGSGCCGAIRLHMTDHEGGLNDVRRNVDAWFPMIESGEVEGIVINASGCGSAIREYGHLLADDPAYAARAAAVSEATRDVGEFVAAEVGRLVAALAHDGGPKPALGTRVAFHPPCTLQHGQKIVGVVEAMLRDLGAEVVPFPESHLCCGSAGTYSVLHPEISHELRDRKLANIATAKPDVILSANIGCIAHLGAGTGTPVRHWVEWVDERLAAQG